MKRRGWAALYIAVTVGALVSCAGAGVGVGGLIGLLSIASLVFVISCIGPEDEVSSASAPADAGAIASDAADGDALGADADIGPCLSVEGCLCVVTEESDDSTGALSAGLIGAAGLIAVRRRRRKDSLERLADRLPDDVVRRLEDERDE
jgi:MYXO-CTERM domain-containing protein